MILLRKSHFVLLVAVPAAFLGGVGVTGYLAGSRGLPTGEIALYLCFVGMLLLAVAVSFALRRAVRVYHELDKSTELLRAGSYLRAPELRRLGVLGSRIQDLNSALLELNELKSTRISALGALNAFLLRNMRRAILVVNAAGKVTGATESALEKLGKERPEVLERHIGELLELDYGEIASRLAREHASISGGSGQSSVTFYPIHDRSNEVAAVVCALGKEELVAELPRRREARREQPRRRRGLLRRYLDRGSR